MTSGSSAATVSPGLDEDLDDRDVGEVADVGDRDLSIAHRSALMPAPAPAGPGSMLVALDRAWTVAGSTAPSAASALQRGDATWWRSTSKKRAQRRAVVAAAEAVGAEHACSAPGTHGRIWSANARM